MAIERHLILQELTLRPSGEWTPQFRGWLVARVAEGSGYWLHDGPARELNAGDGFVMSGNVRAFCGPASSACSSSNTSPSSRNISTAC